ncbi:hypothetical protein KA478_01960 [Patescibacteria group bacterium]|nr:hypothetical protein [Patescibacteria group bacterium]
MTEKTISYTKYEWKDNVPSHIVAVEKTAQIRDDLALTLGRMGFGDFFKHMPLETLEQFLRDITTGGVDLAYEEQVLRS